MDGSLRESGLGSSSDKPPVKKEKGPSLWRLTEKRISVWLTGLNGLDEMSKHY
jgi:hypothetical protein